ncbi:RTA1-domain-containing protein [Westerdykella ornata]|uniref:RTA1-domain-containing protein n=1 Tax=Westerdykella ornata TaxID=318751 RepID=A0A6A6J8N0_WESOR|nr:RTA1-domain-containing protein [Westerdykella ornata]KAF2272607.1 RTA1-domain-containing protein [Westerdykella ornata]
MVSQCANREGGYELYAYSPSLPAAIIFIAIFGTSAVLHIWQAGKKRSWFMTPFIIGGLMETVGYVGRALSHHNTCSLTPYIIQTLLLLLGPALFAASIYMILGRIILLTDGEPYALIRRTWLTKIFVGGDVLCFLMQLAGGGMLASADGDPDKAKLGENLVVGGLFVQLAFFGFFILVAALFQMQGRHHLAGLPQSLSAWRRHLYVLYGTSLLILVRSVFRVVEYFQGEHGYLLSHEVFLYIFDASLMAAAMVAMNVVHPGDIALLLKGKSLEDGREGFLELDSRGMVEGHGVDGHSRHWR